MKLLNHHNDTWTRITGMLVIWISIFAISCETTKPINKPVSDPKNISYIIPPSQPLESALGQTTALNKNIGVAKTATTEAEVKNTKIGASIVGDPLAPTINPLVVGMSADHSTILSNLAAADAQNESLKVSLAQAKENFNSLQLARDKESKEYATSLANLKENHKNESDATSAANAKALKKANDEIAKLVADDNDPYLGYLKAVKLLAVPALLVAGILFYLGRIPAGIMVAAGAVLATCIAESIVKYQSEFRIVGAVLCILFTAAGIGYCIYWAVTHKSKAKSNDDDKFYTKDALIEVVNVLTDARTILTPDIDEKIFGKAGILATQLSTRSRDLINEIHDDEKTQNKMI